MIVVADAGPLQYLVRIGAVDVLAPLYQRVLVPQTVASELQQNNAPAAIRAWIAQPPVCLV
jgi:predicted nucleic acid-binding protein